MVFIVWPFNNDRPSSSSWNWKHLRKISFHFWWNSFRSLSLVFSLSHSFNLPVSHTLYFSFCVCESFLLQWNWKMVLKVILVRFLSVCICVFLSLFCEEAKETRWTETGCWRMGTFANEQPNNGNEKEMINVEGILFGLVFINLWAAKLNEHEYFSYKKANQNRTEQRQRERE